MKILITKIENRIVELTPIQFAKAVEEPELICEGCLESLFETGAGDLDYKVELYKGDPNSDIDATGRTVDGELKLDIL